MDANSICSDDSNNSYEEIDNYNIQAENYDRPPLLTNTTLTVMRHCGKYLKICSILKSISEDVVTCLCQLFEYYLYSIHLLFTSDNLVIKKNIPVKHYIIMIKICCLLFLASNM
jgi:phage terminase small subunit